MNIYILGFVRRLKEKSGDGMLIYTNIFIFINIYTTINSMQCITSIPFISSPLEQKLSFLKCIYSICPSTM